MPSRRAGSAVTSIAAVQTSVGVSFVSGVVADGAGGVLYADQFRGAIRRAYGNGSVYTLAGNGTQGYSGEAVAHTQGRRRKD